MKKINNVAIKGKCEYACVSVVNTKCTSKAYKIKIMPTNVRLGLGMRSIKSSEESKTIPKNKMNAATTTPNINTHHFRII